MSDFASQENMQLPIEDVLRAELAQGDIVLGTVAPILGHLVTNTANSLFNDHIVAQIRGMATSVARQLLSAEAVAAEETDPLTFIAARQERLATDLLADSAFLSHCHALTIEMQLAVRLERRSAIDPVLSPLLQALISSDDADTASAAMAALTAQARFVQQHKRMELSINDVPGDQFHAALLAWRNHAREGAETATEKAEAQLRSAYDEASSRLGLLSRLVSGMGNGSLAALSLSHAGVAIFLSALAKNAGQDRNLTALGTNDRQVGRLALTLRAAGLTHDQVEEQFVYLHPDVVLPQGFDMLRTDRAAEILAESATRTVG
ncbi:hypothetical protein [Pontixanthobacter sp.]|uniref:hypothetical protein n=1 Tax=Pontixanthobacter sp. TaxID=2792078 RepID=UPI003C7BF0C2